MDDEETSEINSVQGEVETAELRIPSVQELLDNVDDLEETGHNPLDPLAIEAGLDGGLGVIDEDVPEDTASEGSHPSSDMSLESPGSEDDSDLERLPRWMIPQNRLRSAVDMMVSQARNRDGGIAALLNRDNFLQRVRSMVFSQERQRSRTSEDTSQETTEQTDEPPPPPPSRPQIDIELERGVRFDTNLPAEHLYFGNHLSRVPGVDYLEVGSTHHMLIFLHQHILFPGEVLPFMLDDRMFDEDMPGLDGLIFGVGFPHMQPPDDIPHKLYGVTCQIYEKGESGRELMFYKSRALQRIIINCDDIQGPPQYIARNPISKCFSKVKILPEYFLPEPLQSVEMGSMARFRDIPSMQDKYRRFQLASTPWPADVCQEYSFDAIVKRARQRLEVQNIDTMPKCPIQLSFWLVRNLHLTEKMMRLTFLTDSVNTRLQLIKSTFKEESLFFCRYCNSTLAHCADLFAMSKHGVQTQYCNPEGYIHETNTVYRVMSHAIGYSGEPSTKFSWFPGYQWHIILCKFCAQHVGWEFKAVQPNLAPRVFFGLAGSSVRIGKASENRPVNGSTYVVRNMLRLISNEME